MTERDPRFAQRQAAQRSVASFEEMVQRAVERAFARVADVFTDRVIAPRLGEVTSAAEEPFSELDAAILRNAWEAELAGILLAVETVYRAAMEDIAQQFTAAIEAMNVEPRVQEYLREARNRLTLVGDDLWEAARSVIMDGSLDGLSIPDIAQALVVAFGQHGVELDLDRAIRIARTETIGAWNGGADDTVNALPEDLQPEYQTWLATFDTRTRDTHFTADGQTMLLGAPFLVGGFPMRFPGDPLGPPQEVINCRCTVTYGEDPDAPPDDGRQYLSDERIRQIIEHYESEGVTRPAHTASGVDMPTTEATAAADEEHTSGMIALVPTADDAERLAVPGGEDPDELHVTLAFLGDAGNWTAAQREDLIAALRGTAFPGEVRGDAFGVNHWNPHGDDPCWVYAIGGSDVAEAHGAVWEVAFNEGVPEIPEQHSPWVAHLTAAYSTDRDVLEAMVERLGPVTFDRIRVAFSGAYTDIPLGNDNGSEEAVTADATETTGRVRRWSTPGDKALAFEDEQTGDGRVFAPGALYWEGDSWPLQYARQMLGGHAGAELVGLIDVLMRDGGRIAGAGGLYVDTEAGAEAAALYDQGAPLGVSVDLDDVDVEVVDNRPPEERESEDDDEVVLLASLSSASVLNLGEGRWSIRPGEVRVHTASGQPRSASLRDLVASVGLSVTAAAGDGDPDDGEILFEEKAGDMLFRVTRGRLRGSTVVAMPAFARASIVLNDLPEVEASAGGEVVAAVVGDTELPVNSDRERDWDGGKAASRVLASATDDDGNVDADKLAKAFLYRDDDANPETVSAYKLGFADVVDGRLEIIARGVFAVAGVLQGSMGGVDIPESDRKRIRSRVEDLYERLADEFDDDTIKVPWDDDSDDEEASAFVAPPMEVEASAWDEFQAIPAMPAGWFAEPTREELGEEDGGFHYDRGRIFGWVAQKGVCHDGYTDQCLMIDDFGNFDLTTFLRAKIDLDNGDEVAVGVFTMNTGHRNDGANVRNFQRQFDDTRTVAGIVTVGLNDRGLWFSGAAAPWLSEWDMQVFNTCRPSGHWKEERRGRWSLRAVLSVPVPGYANRLAASAFVHRSNMALSAAAGTTMPEPAEFDTELVASAGVFEPDTDSMRALASAVVDEMEKRAEERRAIDEMFAQIEAARNDVVESMRRSVTQEA